LAHNTLVLGESPEVQWPDWISMTTPLVH